MSKQYFLPTDVQELVFAQLYRVHGERFNPRQGATQLVSSLRYLLALDRFVKQQGHNPDCKQSDDRKFFISYVGDVVALNDNDYTVNFAGDVRHISDYAVGSNFFSVNAVAASLNAPRKTVYFPSRKLEGELMAIRNGVLALLDTSYTRMRNGLHDESVLAFVCLWLVRRHAIADSPTISIHSLYKAVSNVLSSLYSNKLVETFLPEREQFVQQLLRVHIPESLSLSDSLQYPFSDEVIVSEQSSPSRIALPQPTRPLQQVFYGAPGTGKSYAIKHVEDKGTKPIRTTFHPDSDYASFVGAYKPTMELVPPDGQGADKYATKQIVYAFVPQAFLQAYVAAWCHYPEPQYLIIEELNRGHCAQIFGDLFQLLDRDGEGFSEYPVYPDADLQSYLAEALGEADFPEGLDLHYQLEYPNASQELARGRLMALPNNLYIWATLNTSDQSLFPMDSAFKRRWAWHYVPIADAGLAWTIEAAGKTWDWWACLQAINARIEELTVSEDKKLGYFFTMPPKGTAIPAEQFVSKVIFYLFGDVFRDYGMENSLFSLPDGQPVRFSMFYENVLPEQTVDEELLAQCLQSLGLKPL